MNDLPGITHQFGPWSPVRFIPLPYFESKDDAPAFWATTTRICTGLHDWRCTHVDTQTYGPLVLQGRTEDDLYRCPSCRRVQPPVDTAATGQTPVCLYCSDMATVQHLGDESAQSTAAVSALAALHAATGVMRRVKEADPAAYVQLLDETGDSLRAVMDDVAYGVKQDPRRAGYSVTGSLVLVARQIVANARAYGAKLEAKEPFPDKEVD